MDVPWAKVVGGMIAHQISIGRYLQNKAADENNDEFQELAKINDQFLSSLEDSAIGDLLRGIDAEQSRDVLDILQEATRRLEADSETS